MDAEEFMILSNRLPAGGARVVAPFAHILSADCPRMAISCDSNTHLYASGLPKKAAAIGSMIRPMTPDLKFSGYVTPKSRQTGYYTVQNTSLANLDQPVRLWRGMAESVPFQHQQQVEMQRHFRLGRRRGTRTDA